MKKYISVPALALGLTLAAAAPAFALGLDAGADLSASSSSSSDTRTSSSASVNIGLDADVAPANGISASSAASVDITGPSQVQTDDDLDAYSASIRQGDSSVSQVTSTDTSVSVEYRIPAKLFGFISVGMAETASVSVNSDNTTSVSVRRPWWAVFAKADDRKDAFQADLKARVPGSISSAGAVEGAVGSKAINSSFKAQFISDIEASAKATF